MSPFENMELSEVDSMYSSSASSPSSFTSSEECCAVCGNEVVNSSRYGAPGCLGCVVFFRRAIVRNSTFKCLRDGNCNITNEYRCACRFCRLQKCFTVGMRPEAIQRRDLVGPRSPVDPKSSLKNLIDPVAASENDTDDSSNLLQNLVLLQNQQTSKALQYFTENNLLSSTENSRRADSNDVNLMLKLCMNQASEWGRQLKPFKRISIESKQSILAEYGFAFLLVDQGFKTAREAKDGFWILQNNTFMNADYFLGMPKGYEFEKTTNKKAELHEKFVTDLLNSVAKPFRDLEIDEIECAALKTVLLLTPSFSKRAVYAGQEGYVASVHTQCMEELMEHSLNMFPDRGEERFGEILLLISSIRCGIKAIYNQTRVSDVFNFFEFDSVVRDILLC
ncbi:Protein CBG10360 [Caenorhabditis briggsae]|uniref:Protein CBG10360 n=1 Tax=Caenorhabditis briggsae TaxID=6238 RepID=A8XB14_CAEBR|nr:Protein CBG10360 [Caenorhabditis briggsae]CAP29794.2 Protein CBG10360 [Caenorhabditis briggsae]